MSVTTEQDLTVGERRFYRLYTNYGVRWREDVGEEIGRVPTDCEMALLDALAEHQERIAKLGARLPREHEAHVLMSDALLAQLATDWSPPVQIRVTSVDANARHELICRELPAALDERFAEISKLEANWDSYGASPIDRRAIESARRVIAALSHSPQIVPTTSGGIQLEWHRDGIDFDLVIPPEGATGFIGIDELSDDAAASRPQESR